MIHVETPNQKIVRLKANLKNKNIKNRNRKINLSQMDLTQFLIKLKGLIKKIAKCNPVQLQSHTEKCHTIVVDLISDDDLLKNLNPQKLRLLSYQVILFLVEMMNKKDQDLKSNFSPPTKIEIFLDQINKTLTDIKQLILSLSVASHEGLTKEDKKYSNQKKDFDQLQNSLYHYQKKIGNIITSFQSQNHFNRPKHQTSDHLRQPNDENDDLIEEMQRLIEKKERKISSVMKQLQKLQNQKIELQVSCKKTINKLHQANDSLEKQIDDLKFEKKKKLEEEEKQKQSWLKKEKKDWFNFEKNRIQSQLRINSVFNQQIINFSSSLKKLPSNQKVQAITQQQNLSYKKQLKRHYEPSRKISLDKTRRTNSFRRIGFLEDKDSVQSEKRVSEKNEINEQLYRFIFCQASTIQELF